MRQISVLIIDDSQDDSFLIKELLLSVSSTSFNVDWVSNYEDGLNSMVDNEYDLFIVDYRLGFANGLDLLEEAKKGGCVRPVILLSGYGDYSVDLEAMNRGATDYISKNELNCHILERSIRYALERHRVEQKLKSSIAEKEVLLKELHHRVKNNLQIITSLLRIEASNRKPRDTSEVLRELQRRISSIRIIHEQLYSTQSFSKINLSLYLDRLISHLASTYNVLGNRVKMDLQLEDILVPVNTAITCGLLLNELVSNCFKHAFPNERRGYIRVGLGRGVEERCELTVADNGVGIPAGVDLEHSDSLGLEIVSMLVRQLKGTLKLSNDGETCFVVSFPIKKSLKGVEKDVQPTDFNLRG